MAQWDLFVNVTDEADAEEAERWALRLRDELAGLDIEGVEPARPGPVAADLAHGAKGLPEVVGWLGLALGAVSIEVVAGLIIEWVSRTRKQLEVVIGDQTLRVSGGSSDDQVKIVEAWLRQHPAGL